MKFHLKPFFSFSKLTNEVTLVMYGYILRYFIQSLYSLKENKLYIRTYVNFMYRRKRMQTKYNRGVLFSDVCLKRWKSINSVSGSSYIENNKLWYLYLYVFHNRRPPKKIHSSLLNIAFTWWSSHCRFLNVLIIFVFSFFSWERTTIVILYIFILLFI